MENSQRIPEIREALEYFAVAMANNLTVLILEIFNLVHNQALRRVCCSLILRVVLTDFPTWSGICEKTQLKRQFQTESIHAAQSFFSMFPLN